MARRSRTVAKSSNRAPDRRLGRAFFDRPTVRVARELLGTVLWVGDRAARIVETEAYVANDPASHAFRGRTERNRSMFAAPGTLYVYRIHQVVCANLVTKPGEAVLLRAGEPLTPGIANPSGPGRLCRALGIELADDGTPAATDSRVRVEPAVGGPGRIDAGPRVGIRQATDRRLRFALSGNPWVSRPGVTGPRRSARARVISASPSRSSAGGTRRRTRTTRTRSSVDGRSGDRSDGR
jgi:DNA-3-methyladenine glycosylase